MRKPKRASDTPPENGSAPVPPSSDKAAAHVRELDAQALLHELRVHQFELEMQNEELRRARGEMEIALRLYTEIFDFSPIGYATIQADYVIVNVNFAACEMLRRPRALLNGMSFERFVAYPCRVHFCALIGEAWSSGEKQTRQLDLLEEGAKEICVRLSAIPLLRTQPTILLAIEALASEALASEPPPLNAN